MARLMWRKKNLVTCRIVERLQQYCEQIALRQVSAAPPKWSYIESIDGSPEYRKQLADATRTAEDRARQELGGLAELIDIGQPATIDGLMKELDVKERLDGLIDKRLKQLLMVRGVKSLSLTPRSAPSREKLD
jgi:hypothetical protein